MGKRFISVILSIVMAISFVALFAVPAAAQDDVTIIPKVTVHPSVDGVISENEWDGAYVETMDYESARIKISKDLDSGVWADVKPTASIKMSMVWYMPEDAENWDVLTDTESGFYMLFEVQDTTRPWYFGANGASSADACSTDNVEVCIDPGLRQSYGEHRHSYCYVFTPTSAQTAGAGAVPGGNGFWWEYWQKNCGESTGGQYAEIASEANFEFDPAFPLPEAESPSYKTDYENAYRNADQTGYISECFISFSGLGYTNPKDSTQTLYMVNDTQSAVGTQFGMAVGLIDYYYDGDLSSGVYDYTHQQLIAGMSNIGSDDWSEIDYTHSYRVWELGPNSETMARFCVNSPIADVDKTITATVLLEKIPTAIGAAKLDLKYNSEYLELASTEAEIIKSVRFSPTTIMGSDIVDVNTDIDSNVRLTVINVDGVSEPCAMMSVKFKVLKPIDEYPELSLEVKELVSAQENPVDMFAFVSYNIVAGVMKGDIDGNEKIELSDAMKCFQHVAKKITLEGNKFEAADIDENGKIELSDAMKIFQFVAKKITTF